MSKWSLLLKGGSRDKNISTCSIHRFSGFETVVPCQRMIWTAFRLHLTSHQVHTVHSLACLSRLIDTYLQHTVDCTECLVTFEYGQSEQQQEVAVENNSDRSSDQLLEQIHRLEAIIREGTSMGLYRITTLQMSNTSLTAEFFALSSLSSFVPSMKVCEYRGYRLSLPSISPSTTLQSSQDVDVVPEIMMIYTREKPSTVKVTKAGLLSHQLFGVDNTGNVRVWSSEPLLLHTILHRPKYFDNCVGRHVLELGGGLTGLCGLGLAALAGCASVIITDGHPDCVKNQKVCIEMNRQKRGFAQGQGLGPALSGQGLGPGPVWSGQGLGCVDAIDDGSDRHGSCVIDSHLLRWSIDDAYGDYQAIIETKAKTNTPQCVTKHTQQTPSSSPPSSSPPSSPSSSSSPPSPPSHGSGFDVVIAADCLFFTEFHDALIDTIKTALTPPSASSSIPSSSSSSSFIPIAYLLQPRRGGTMETFMRKASVWFHMEIEEDYNDHVTSLRQQYQTEESILRDKDDDDGSTEKKGFYDEDIHYPVLLTLRLKRPHEIDQGY